MQSSVIKVRIKYKAELPRCDIVLLSRWEQQVLEVLKLCSSIELGNRLLDAPFEIFGGFQFQRTAKLKPGLHPIAILG